MDAAPSILHDATVANLLIALKRSPDDRDLLLRLALAFNARNMPERAEAPARRLLELDPLDSEAWYELIVARSFVGPDAVAELRRDVDRLVARLPRAAWTHRNAALLAYFCDDDQRARAQAAAALEADPADPHADEVLAYLAYTIGDLDAAIEHGIKAVELKPDNFRALHWLGECYARLDADEQAIRYFHRALRMEDGHFLALESLGSLYFRRDETHAMALQCFAKILAINPRWFPAWFRLADHCIEHERFEEAAAHASSVLRLGPDDEARADAHQYLGLIRLMQGSAEAAVHFETALAIDPMSAAAHHYLGVALERAGDKDAAERRFRKAIALDPTFSLPRTRLGYACFDRGQLELARRHFAAALEADADDYLAHLGLGELARTRGDHDAQLARVRRAAELAPGDSNVRNQLGTAFDALGRTDEAAAEYEEALRLDPLNRQAANNLGHLLERLLRRASGKAATDLKRRAVDAWRMRLVACLATGGSTRAAVAHLRKLGVAASQVERWRREAESGSSKRRG